MTRRPERHSGRKTDSSAGSFYMGRMRPPPKPQRVLPRGLLTTISLVCFAVIIWAAYPEDQEKYAGMDIPVIKADTAPYKFKPDNPGGMEVLHQDSTVFDPLERKPEKVERLMPQPENPVDKDAAVGEKATLEAAAPKLNLDLQMKPVAEGTEKIVLKESATRKTPTAIPSRKPGTKTPEPEKIYNERTAEKPAVKPAAKAETKPVAAKDAEIVWETWVRLGSYRNLSGAYDDWSKLKKRHPQLLGKLQMRTVKVDLGAKGVFHRLEAGKVSDGRAREICRSLSSANPGGCIVVK
jgi:hypothetical protein